MIQNQNIFSVKYSTENWQLIDPWFAFLLLELNLLGETHPIQAATWNPTELAKK